MVWISVDERLPQYDESVLVVLRNCGSGKMVQAVACRKDKEDATWFIDDYEVSYNFDVTHWMPLPPLPNEATDDET